MKDQKGTSLVSVIVSFAVLMIVVLLLQVSISASGRYAARANEVWDQVTKAENHYTNEETGASFDNIEIKMQTGEVWGTLNIRATRTTDESGAVDTDYIIYYVE